MKYLEQQKLSLVPETFCQGLPQEMVNLFTYVKSLQTNNSVEKIDYDYLKKLFKNLVIKHTPWDNFQYDWVYYLQ